VKTARPHTDFPQSDRDQARRDLSALAQQVRALVQADLALPDFAAGLLKLIVPGTQAVAGGLWQTEQRAGPARCGQHGLQAETPLADCLFGPQNVAAILQVASDGEAKVISFDASGGNGLPDTPQHPLLLVPVSDGSRSAAVVEVVQRGAIAAGVQHGHLRLLEQLCEIAGGYFKSHRLASLTEKETLWGQLGDFVRRIHGSLELQPTAYAIANEGRRVVDCDRLSVAVRRGGSIKTEAVSGQDQLDRRSESVRLLDCLVQVVCLAGEPLWYDGATSDLPPQMEEALQDYVDESDTRSLGIVPLTKPEPIKPIEDHDSLSAPQPSSTPDIFAAIVVEQINTAGNDALLRQRTDLVCEHATQALANAAEHEKIFLLPLWRSLGQNYDRLVRRRPTRTAVIGAMVLAGILALILVPADFYLEGRGTLQPSVRREVFAQIDGVVDQLEVDHGQTVKDDQRLLRLRNLELQSKAADVRGRLTATREQLRTVRRSLLEKLHENDDETSRLSGQLADLRKNEENLAHQLDLYQQQLALLEVNSPVAGTGLVNFSSHCGLKCCAFKGGFVFGVGRVAT